MKELIHALLAAETEAKRLRREKLGAKLEAVNAIAEPRKKNVFLDSRLFSL